MSRPRPRPVRRTAARSRSADEASSRETPRRRPDEGLRALQPSEAAQLERVDSTHLRQALREPDDPNRSGDEVFVLSDEERGCIEELAHTYLLSGAFEIARALYAGLAALEPNEAASHLGHGLALQRLGLVEAARRAYARAVRAEPEDPTAYLNLAELHLRRGDEPRADKYLAAARPRARSNPHLCAKVEALRHILSLRRSS